MSLPVVVTTAADADLEQAAEWYERQQRGLGAKLVTRVDETLALISDNPELYAVLRDNVRRAPVRKFPYGVFYQVRGTYVEVAAIVHNRRSPLVWQRRI